MLRVDEKEKHRAHIVILPPQDEPFKTFYMEANYNDYTRTYYRSEFDFAN